MSETPETDMLLSIQHHDCVPFDDAAGQLADLAQKLEHERDEARNLADSAMWEADRLRSKLHTHLVKYDSLFEEAEKIRTERDEAREFFVIATDQCTVAYSKLREAVNERDEAQKECLEQARLLGMGGEREAKLISERDNALNALNK